MRNATGLLLLTLSLTVAAASSKTRAQDIPGHGNGFPSDVAKCAHNPPEWYGFANRPDCAQNWPKGARFWDFVDDFRYGSTAENPSRDSYGNQAVWAYRLAAAGWTPGNWAATSLLDSFGPIGNATEVGWSPIGATLP